MSKNINDVTPPPPLDIVSRRGRRESGMTPTSSSGHNGDPHGAHNEAAVLSPWRVRLPALCRSVAARLLLWAGENVIALLPLGAAVLIPRFSGHPVPEPVPEVCILAVVNSGLSLLPLLRFGPHQRVHRMTPISYTLALASLLTLMAGGMMYGLAVTENAHGDTGLAYLNLTVSEASSFLLAIEIAILEA